jgi:feruloyl esterase
MGIMVKYGFAVVSTDTGHRGGFGDVNFAINADGTWNTEQIADSAYRALHGSVVLGKQLTVGNYGRNISYSYYNGCSTGGRQGLTEVQRFPEDFDGVLAGSPAWETDVIGLWTVQMGMINLPNTSENHIPTTMYPVIQAEVMRQCDGIDGVEDGVIMDPQACHFRPETLLCAGQNASEGSCVTSPQIDTLHQLYGHYPTVEKPLFFHPLPLGSEPAWASSLPEDEPASVSWAAILSFQDPNWDWRTLNYSGIQEATTRFYTGGADMVPNQFDITPFAKRGGKLFHYHGQGDTTVPYESSRTWYENTYRNVTTKGVDVDNFYRLFFVPGMLHCLQSNGDAPWYFGAGEQPEILGSDAYGVPGFRDEQHDAVLALMKWVEEGAAPDHIVATKYVNDNVSLGFKRQRKICKYPGRAKFVGDEVDDADSWVC